MTFLFGYLLRDEVYPRLPFVPMPSWALFDTYNSFAKVAITTFVSVPIIILNSPFLVPLGLLGMFLYTLKLFASVKIQRFWKSMWTGKDTEQVEKHPNLDTRVLNESVFTQIVFEALPQLVIQCLNNIEVNSAPWV